MQESKLIAIVGATGAQGGGLARAILEDPQGGFRVRAITRNVDSDKARALAAAGADIVAVDATRRPRSGGLGSERFVARLARELARPVLADVDCFEAGVAARAAGAAAVATTLSGYTGDGPVPAEPDLELVARLAAELDCPVLAEGRYATPESVRDALEAGAFAVVVGTAITDAVALTRRFASACARSVGVDG